MVMHHFCSTPGAPGFTESKPYLSAVEERLSYEGIRMLFREETESMGYLKDQRLTKPADLPPAEAVELVCKEGKIRFIKLPEHFPDTCYVMFGKIVSIHMNEPVVPKLLNTGRQVLRVDGPMKGKEYGPGDMDTVKIPTKEGFHKLYRHPCYEHFVECPGSMIEVFLIRGGLIRFNLYNVAPIGEAIFRRSKVFENAFDLLIGGSDVIPAQGDYTLENISDGALICDPVLHAALMRQACIYLVGGEMNQICAYKVTFSYLGEERGRDTFFDAGLNSGQTAYDYNHRFFRDVDLSEILGDVADAEP